MSTLVRDVLQQVSQGRALDEDAAERFMHELMEGRVTAVQTAGLLAAMAVRGEAVSEIVGFARAMRAHSVRLDTGLDVVDTCGTGGDGGQTFNISTAAAIVAAACGVPVAKHGNRAVSSRSGSADVLHELGAAIQLSAEEALACLEETNLCFLFAQAYHPAMKHAAEPRKQLGFRTIFNILGPLTNPAGARRQVLGVYRADLVDKVAEALNRLGTTHALVVHGDGGIDEISLQGETLIAEVRDGRVRTYTVVPEDFGLRRAGLAALAGGDAAHNASIIRRVLEGETGPARDVVVLNAGAVLHVAGRADSIADGVRLAQAALDSGDAAAALSRFVEATHRYHREEVAQ
ncbi:anthranilate phosphoribosyltransferase [Alicyclobacillus sp.]|uniref:anthranilate phosphoribosyltransferase n=1 Tax=Alicyclobacillus sp. TaxID=61169 RepID=UPI0025C11CDE|nr:anthranilate phosphoribosyltransferase [Alicyclobacillus sp.]MCL6515552.1 anthranilate phosphoribosyltransferase [Alicyclobacillus sp.]